MRRSGALLLVVAACKKESATIAPPSPWLQFEGIEYLAPLGTSVQGTDGVLPGPNGQGGMPSGVRPKLTLSLAGPHGFYVELARGGPETLDGTKYIYGANKIALNLVGKVTPTGWELDYDGLSSTGQPIGKAHIIYTELAGKHFECQWADTNCGDPAAAEAICRSIRVAK